MNPDAFSSPVFVKRATYIVQEIASLADAIDFLNEWPDDRRDLIHEAALRACYDAYDGRKPVSAARNAFALRNGLPYWKMQFPRCNGSLPASPAVEKCRYRRLARGTPRGHCVEISRIAESRSRSRH